MRLTVRKIGYPFINPVIDILKHISISVLQAIKSEIKIEAEDCEDIDVKVPYSTTLLATQINWYAIWQNKMKFMEIVVKTNIFYCS